MSEQVERRLVELLGHPQLSPYGNPIPGLGELGSHADAVTETHADLQGADSAATAGGRYEVRRIIEIVQNQPKVMTDLHAAGIIPGAVLGLGMDGDAIIADVDGHRTEIDESIAHGIHVRPAPVG
jgi:DtxR family Mn-dependent transcriptional regulator